MRPSAWTWLKGAALAAVVLLASSPAAAVPGAFASSPGGGRLRPGEELALSWNLDPGSTNGRDEMELVLSLDGGATFPIRVTGHLEPETRTLRWRVPRLPTEHARLALRAGDDELARTEEILAVSEPFVIASADVGDVEELYAVADEWRTREALEGAPVRPLPREIKPRGAEGDLAPTGLDAVESETVSASDDGHRTEESGWKVEPASRTTASRSPSALPRSLLPLRL